MTELSPAAEAVIDASWGGVPAGVRHPYAVRCEQMAAAIRTAATHPQTIEMPDVVLPEGVTTLKAIAKLVAKVTAEAYCKHMLAIATELDQEAAELEGDEQPETVELPAENFDALVDRLCHPGEPCPDVARVLSKDPPWESPTP